MGTDPVLLDAAGCARIPQLSRETFTNSGFCDQFLPGNTTTVIFDELPALCEPSSLENTF
jgi:hypothetical protein